VRFPSRPGVNLDPTNALPFVQGKTAQPVILSEAKDLALSIISPIGSSFVVRFPSRPVVNHNRADVVKLRARSFASLRMTGLFRRLVSISTDLSLV
jgi:hypothetical protein